MGTYLVETYLSADTQAEPSRTMARTTAAVERLQVAGEPIRYLRAIFIPEEETFLLLLEAPSIGLVRAAVEAAGLNADRISRTVLDEA